MEAATMELSLLREISEKLDRLNERMDEFEGKNSSAPGTRYPKQVMKTSELIKLGFTKEYLMKVYRMRNQKVAWKLSESPNSVILYDTVELEKLRKSQCLGGR